jgi:hypothetical protein
LETELFSSTKPNEQRQDHQNLINVLLAHPPCLVECARFCRRQVLVTLYHKLLPGKFQLERIIFHENKLKKPPKNHENWQIYDVEKS